ncbi:hypothetical protein ACHAXA_002702 [Cyclostephanos tholiformis]|uniref:Uncharacterized protein n=1 Tax=Cyclostephanos tholiformis TaxID=382380 RepID=A0ABD3R6G9_9STRA
MSSNHHRDSFGDAGIDWAAAIEEADAWIMSSAGIGASGGGASATRVKTMAAAAAAASTAHSTTDRRRATVGNSSSSFVDIDEDGGYEMHNAGNENTSIINNDNRDRRDRCPIRQPYLPKSSSSMELTSDQLARIEENRRKALERRERHTTSSRCRSSSQSFIATTEQSTSWAKSSSSTAASHHPIRGRASFDDNDRERQRRGEVCIEDGRDGSGATKKNLQQHVSCDIESDLVRDEAGSDGGVLSTLGVLGGAMTNNIISDEQWARIEANKRMAMERRRHRMSQLAMASSSTIVVPVNAESTTFPIHDDVSGCIRDVIIPKVTDNSCCTRTGATEEDSQLRRLREGSPSSTKADEQLLPNNALDSSGPTVNRPDIESSAEEEEAKFSGGDGGSALEKLEITMQSRDDDRKLPASEIPSTEDLKSSTIPHYAKSPTTKKKSGLPPIPPELRYDESRVLPIDDDYIDALIENAALDETLLNGWSLFGHQREGVMRGLRMRRLILAFDMGLGKTIIACVWAKAFRKTFEGIKIFVIAPVSLHDEWERTAIQATGLKLDNGDGARGKKGKSKTRKREKGGGNEEDEYERTVTGKRRMRARNKSKSDSEDDSELTGSIDMHIFSWDGISACNDFILDTPHYVVIADEAHRMQSMESNRTKEALKLISQKKCRGVLLLSGTPMKNGRPSNLFPLLRAVQHPFGDNQKRYEFFFCNGQQRNIRGMMTWDATGSSNLKELHAHTASHIFRMTKEECMSSELPPRKREIVKMPVPSRHELRYTQALKDLAEAFNSSHTSCGGDNDDTLSSLMRLRQISAVAKVDAIVSLSNSILIKESSIVIFTSFVAVAKDIYRKLEDMDWAGELLTGETVSKKRQAMVDRFQTGISPVFVCTYGAGGVGLTLTAACTVVLVDRPWTPGDVNQAEDRVRRIGQKRPVRSIWVRSFPIDDRIDELIDHKEVNSSAAVDGKDHGGQNRNAPKVSIAQLVKSVLGNQENGS